MKCPKSLIQKKIEVEFQKKIPRKDLHNIAQASTTADDDSLPAAESLLREKYGNIKSTYKTK